MWKSGLASLLGLAAGIASVQAGVIGLGIDWRKHVYLQEYWQEDVPYYAIANLGKASVTIKVNSRNGGNLLAGPWTVQPGKPATVDARAIVGKELIEFSLADGASLGLLVAPTKTNAPKGPLVSYEGLNGSGGRQTTLWIEQAKESVPPGEVFSVILKIPGNAGVITWSRKPGSNGPLIQLPLIDAKSASLPVEKNGDGVEIDTGKPTTIEAIHAVTLRFRAPAAEVPTMAMIGGLRTLPGGGAHTVTRGILIAPAKK